MKVYVVYHSNIGESGYLYVHDIYSEECLAKEVCDRGNARIKKREDDILRCGSCKNPHDSSCPAVKDGPNACIYAEDRRLFETWYELEKGTELYYYDIFEIKEKI